MCLLKYLSLFLFQLLNMQVGDCCKFLYFCNCEYSAKGKKDDGGGGGGLGWQ
jgi:hypothetical protein